MELNASMKKLIGILLFSLLSFTASAGLVTFNLAGNSGDGAEGAALDGINTGSVTKGVATVELRAVGGDYLLNQTSTRFGMNKVNDSCDSSGQMDSNCGNERIVFMFDLIVELVSITLSDYSSNDQALLAFESSSVMDMILASSPSTIMIGEFVGGVGNRFAIQSLGGNGFSIDSFTIRTSEVSTPATLILFGLAVLSLGWSRRNRA